MPQEKLVCNCKDKDKKPIDKNHVQSKDGNGDTVVECTECGRFIKVKQPQPGIPYKEEE